MKTDERDSSEETELPFVMGVLGDFSADSESSARPLSERKFTRVDRDNLDEVMNRLRPALKGLEVENHLDPGAEGPLTIDHLEFRSMKDFEPEQLALRIPALARLLETRAKLKELSTHADFSPEIQALLERLLR